MEVERLEPPKFSLYPTQKAVWLLALGIPVALFFAVVIPALWAIGAAWAVAIIGLLLLDMLLALPAKSMTPRLTTSPRLYIGTDERVTFDFKNLQNTPPKTAEFRLTTNNRVSCAPDIALFRADENHQAIVQFDITTRRRGHAHLHCLWSRWQGPLGFIWQQRQDPLNKIIAIVPNTEVVRNTALQFFSKDAIFGQKIQNLRGEGTEFDALSEFLPGMDKRAIDWKHSARHNTLLAREYKTERNHNIVFALDSGYLMCEELIDQASVKLTKLDRAISAALIMGYVSLKMGDRVGLYSFDKAPHLYSSPVSGTSQFASLQNQTAQIDYSNEETNYTFGLSYLAQKLRRRSLIVVFTDFIDTTQSELMLETITRLIKRHVIIFVAFKNQPLEDLANLHPKEPDDISRSVIAQTLLSERDIVLAKLKRMGVDVIDANPDTLNIDIVNRYLELKGKGII
ncbi:uncharacterized protein (DUF58 family) [Litorimonas taeanensis]|uniref:Uncharacterized protein (DUF58 family) n=1 Tax=Litorimonas taeanensis TaxID=568099 RepID=A0A420WMI1_9PROT|nr:DUF58 domain-containing protein [Litorimonas taeanensis]RKQ72106.1 uncharacterized protein (DUF58 family) [Litorimonas taeanensis]